MISSRAAQNVVHLYALHGGEAVSELGVECCVVAGRYVEVGAERCLCPGSVHHCPLFLINWGRRGMHMTGPTDVEPQPAALGGR